MFTQQGAIERKLCSLKLTINMFLVFCFLDIFIISVVVVNNKIVFNSMMVCSIKVVWLFLLLNRLPSTSFLPFYPSHDGDDDYGTVKIRIARPRNALWRAILRRAILSTSFIRIARPIYFVFLCLHDLQSVSNVVYSILYCICSHSSKLHTSVYQV